MNAAGDRAALRRALRRSLAVMLPSDVETRLLLCLFSSGDEGSRAWNRWQEVVGDPTRAFKGERLGQKSLLPLLHSAVERNGIEIDSAVASWLRATYFREQLRGNAYRRILDETLTAIRQATGGPAVVLKGCALAETVYPDPCTRHSHGLELLVSDADVERIVATLPRAGFAPVRRNKARCPAPHPLSWRHAAGLPLELRTRLFDIPRYAGAIETAWQRTRPLPDHAALQLAPEEAFLHVCGNAAMSGSRISLRWVCDAWFLLQRHAGFDWGRFLSDVEAARLGLPMSAVVRYLAETLQAPIPESVLRELDALADATDDVGYEIAAMGALVASHARMRRLIIAGPHWRDGLILARRLLAPSPACVREMGWVSGRQSLPMYYLRRPIEYAALRVARLVQRPPAALVQQTGTR